MGLNVTPSRSVRSRPTVLQLVGTASTMQPPPPEGEHKSQQRQEPVIRLHGYDILVDVGVRPHTHVYKVRPKLHDDVPVYMDDEEPCYALKCIEMNEQNLPFPLHERFVRFMKSREKGAAVSEARTAALSQA